ncbi:MAG: hypothetical protein Unbinned6242contig1001_32 [Prokaryotic dsDNA virus sp.]|nr:MAG: hypothetical protein Unbinned6242contig1001_32 [Prokaryotic dsDNA virus sp.]|tara:strand:+ start:5456 stop:5872 length:417 start_codon:yes stop_codon:yes gene_type:complete
MTETFVIGDQVFEMESNNSGDREFSPGHYSCKVIEVTERKSQAGDYQLRLKFQTEDRRWVFDNLTFGKSSRGIAGGKLKILGVKKNDVGNYDLADPQTLIGVEVVLSLVPKGTYVEISKIEESQDFFMGYQIAPDIPF